MSAQPKPVNHATELTPSSFSWKNWNLKDGEWFVNPKAIIEHLERECHTENERVLGYLLRHSVAYQTEFVVKAMTKKEAKAEGRVVAGWSKDGEYALVRITPIDIAKDLGMNRHNVNRALKDFKKNGQIEQEGKTARKTFLKLLIWPKDPKDVINSDSFDNSSPLPLSELIEEFNISLSQSIRKKFFPHLDGTLNLHSELVINPDYRKKVAECAPKVWDRVAPTVKEAWQREWKVELEQIAKEFRSDSRLGVRSNGAYKEERILERKPTSKEQCSIPETRSIDRSIDPSSETSTQTKPTLHQVREYLMQFCHEITYGPSEQDPAKVLRALGDRSLNQLRVRVEYFRKKPHFKITGYGLFVKMAEECGRPLALNREERAEQEYQANLATIAAAKQAEKEARKK